MVGILSAYRGALIDNNPLSLPTLFLSCGIAWGVGILGVIIFQRVQGRFGDEL